MATYRYIYWRSDMGKKEGNRFANIHLLVGYNQRTITDFQGMADELRQTFPGATNDEIRCGSVIKSSYCQEFSLIMWDTYIPEGEYSGWQQKEKGQDYYWQ